MISKTINTKIACPQTFVKFLMDSSCYVEFIENLYKGRGIDLHTYMTRTPPISFISDSFVWSDSKQGITFWSDIDKKWMKYFKSFTDYDKSATKELEIAVIERQITVKDFVNWLNTNSVGASKYYAYLLKTCDYDLSKAQTLFTTTPIKNMFSILLECTKNDPITNDRFKLTSIDWRKYIDENNITSFV